MQKRINIPASFIFLKKGNLSILLREDYKDLIVINSEEDLKNLIKQKPHSHNFEGRRSHPSILLNNKQRVVIKKYYHGGLLGGVLRDLYVFGSRSFEELILTEEAQSCGIQTPKPLCAIHQSIFPFFYKAYLISLEVPGAQDLNSLLKEIGSDFSLKNLILKRKIIRSVAELIKKFHDHGFFHSDLQLKNILVSGEKTFIIDLDRSYRKTELSLNQKIKNILRLKRSIEKSKRVGLPVTRTDQMRFFLFYSEGDITTRDSLKKALRFYRLIYPLHRLGWIIKKLGT